jgi:hyaluronoglucosaminidase
MNMKKTFLATLCLMTGMTIHAQQIDVQPVPQQFKETTETLTLTGSYQFNGENEANPYAINGLKTLLNSKQSAKEGIRIYIGERGDKAIRKYNKFIPKQDEGYFLRISPKEIVLAGNDEQGTFYAVQTLKQLMNDNQLPITEITDYPEVRFRGVVEGFYGTPWSHQARLRHLKFYGENKMNTYIYGPKDDPYHSSPNWRLPYPEKEAKQIKELVQVAKENAVNFVWAIHPGQDIKWNQEDRDNLLAKFEKMYELGVRSYAVFFDDISGEGTKADKQAELLNYIDEQFVKVKKDVTPLIMCPTEYNKSWSNVKGGYLTTLGTKLNPSIHIMWTGDRVIADMYEGDTEKGGMKWINNLIQRPAYVWWNFPVSDYVRDHLLMGPVYGNDLHIANLMSGFVTNPMEHAESSLLAIYGVASYAWNPDQYDSDKAWKDAMKAVLPSAAKELEIFATHNSDLGANGHGYRREESATLKPIAEKFLNEYLNKGTYQIKDALTLLNTFALMQEAADILMVNTENPALIAEMKPWLIQHELMGKLGQSVIILTQLYESGGQEGFLSKYKHVKALQQQMFDVDQTYNQNPYQPGVKTAGLVIKPLIDKTFAKVVELYNQKYNATLDAKSDYMPHTLTSDVNQIKNIPLRQKTNRILVSPANEVIKWQGKGFMTIELDKVYPLMTIDIDFGKPEVAAWGVLEISTNGKDWQKVDFQQNKNRIRVNGDKTPIKAVRFTNNQDKEQEIYMRNFTITVEK